MQKTPIILVFLLFFNSFIVYSAATYTCVSTGLFQSVFSGANITGSTYYDSLCLAGVCITDWDNVTIAGATYTDADLGTGLFNRNIKNETRSNLTWRSLYNAELGRYTFTNLSADIDKTFTNSTNITYDGVSNSFYYTGAAGSGSSYTDANLGTGIANRDILNSSNTNLSILDKLKPYAVASSINNYSSSTIYEWIRTNNSLLNASVILYVYNGTFQLAVNYYGNFSKYYNAEAGRYTPTNFTTNYNAETGRYTLTNFTANYNAEAGRYKKANLTIDYPNLDTDSTNDLTDTSLGTGISNRNIKNETQSNTTWLALYIAQTGRYTPSNFTVNYNAEAGRYTPSNFTANYNAEAGRYTFTNLSADIDKTFTNSTNITYDGVTNSFYYTGTAGSGTTYTGGNNISTAGNVLSINISCEDITGSADLCDGNDAAGGSADLTGLDLLNSTQINASIADKLKIYPVAISLNNYSSSTIYEWIRTNITLLNSSVLNYVYNDTFQLAVNYYGNFSKYYNAEAGRYTSVNFTANYVAEAGRWTVTNYTAQTGRYTSVNFTANYIAELGRYSDLNLSTGISNRAILNTTQTLIQFGNASNFTKFGGSVNGNINLTSKNITNLQCITFGGNRSICGI